MASTRPTHFRRALQFATAALLALTVAAPSASATGLALVIGNASYTSFPSVPACGPSAHEVAAALSHLGFQVIEADDATAGQMEGAIGDFAADLGRMPTAPALVYVCSYATSLTDRTFLLPSSAALTRPTDVLTQGVLANSLIRLVEQRSAASVVALDLVDRPISDPTKFSVSARSASSPGLGMVAVQDKKLGSDTSPLAVALVAGLAGHTVEVGPLLTGIARQVESKKPAATVVALQVPAITLYLAGAPAPPSRSPPPPVAVRKPPPAPAATPVATSVKPSVPRIVMPAEGEMTDAQRREVQIVLASVGYYDGRIDGQFGPETRAAIRRYQFEIHADMTGTLTAAQATTLVNRSFR